MKTEKEIEEEISEMLAKHPEYTENQKVCAEYAARYKKACQVSQERIRQKEAYNLFIKENPTFVGISEGAIRPLINERDLDIKEEAKQKIRSGVSKGQPMEAENVRHIIESLEEGKVKSGRPIRKSIEQVKKWNEEENITRDEMPLPCASCTHVCIPSDKELEYEDLEEKLSMFIEYLLSLGVKTTELKAVFLKVLETFIRGTIRINSKEEVKKMDETPLTPVS